MHVTYSDLGNRKSSYRYLNLAGSIINALPLNNHCVICGTTGIWQRRRWLRRFNSCDRADCYCCDGRVSYRTGTAGWSLLAWSISSHSIGWTFHLANSRNQRSYCRSLVGVFGLVGVASPVATEAVSAVGRFTPLEVRSSPVGIVLAGNSAGILLSRFVGGALTSLLGWRVACLSASQPCS